MTQYIKSLRKYIGTAPILQCGASVIVYKNGKILLQKRKDNGCWSYAGGSVELGENVEETAKRELYEETGLTANSLSLFNVFSGEDLRYIYPNGDEVYNIDILYICSDFYGDLVTVTDETDDLAWFNIYNLPSNISPPVTRPLKTFVNAVNERKTTVYFVRHALPDFKIKDDALRPLSEKGRQDAKKLANVFIEKNIDIIYSSPYNRTIETIQPFADEACLPINIIDDFRERNINNNEWIDNFNDYSLNQWNDFDYKLPHGESLKETQVRNILALNNVLTASKGKNIIVSTHGTALSTIMNYYNPAFGYDNFDKIKMIMPYLLRLDFDGQDLIFTQEVKCNV